MATKASAGASRIVSRIKQRRAARASRDSDGRRSPTRQEEEAGQSLIGRGQTPTQEEISAGQSLIDRGEQRFSSISGRSRSSSQSRAPTQAEQQAQQSLIRSDSSSQQQASTPRERLIQTIESSRRRRQQQQSVNMIQAPPRGLERVKQSIGSFVSEFTQGFTRPGAQDPRSSSFTRNIGQVAAVGSLVGGPSRGISAVGNAVGSTRRAIAGTKIGQTIGSSKIATSATGLGAAATAGFSAVLGTRGIELATAESKTQKQVARDKELRERLSAAQEQAVTQRQQTVFGGSIQAENKKEFRENAKSFFQSQGITDEIRLKELVSIAEAQSRTINGRITANVQDIPGQGLLIPFIDRRISTESFTESLPFQAGIGFTRSQKVARAEAEKIAEERGLTGRRKDEFVAAALRTRTFGEAAFLAGLLASGAGSEFFGGIRIAGALGSQGAKQLTASEIRKNLAKIVGTRTAQFGAVEGGAQPLLEQQTRGTQTTPMQVAFGAGLGAITAGIGGGLLAAQFQRPARRAAVSTVLNIADPFELPQDVISRVVERGLRTQGINIPEPKIFTVRTNADIFSFGQSQPRASTRRSRSTTARSPRGAGTSTFSFQPTSTVSTPSRSVRSPSIATPSINTNTPSNIFNPNIFIPSPSTSTSTNTNTQTSTSTGTTTATNTPTSTITPVNIPITTPIFRLPPPPPLPTPDLFARGFGTGRGKQRKRFVDELSASFKILEGFGISQRPAPRKKAKKSKKRSGRTSDLERFNRLVFGGF